MSQTLEDKRAAVALSTNLSGQLVQAAVTMLTVEGAYIAYALVSRDVHQAFNVVAFFSAFAFVASVFLSGKGITEARNKGFDGDWNLLAGKWHFNAQAVALILGLVLLAAMLWISGPSKETDVLKRVDDLSSSINRFIGESSTERLRLSEQVRQLEDRLEAIDRRSQERASKPLPIRRARAK